ncbi:hypothetical protein TorRG33x02_207250, partial [Trema orientale]
MNQIIGFETLKIEESKKLSQAQRETAFHFLISNRFGFLLEGPAPLQDSPAGTMGMLEAKVAMAH